MTNRRILVRSFLVCDRLEPGRQIACQLPRVAIWGATDADSALVVIHTDAGTSHTSFQGNDMPVDFPEGTVLRAAFPAGDERTWTVRNGTVRVELGAYEGVVLVPQ